MRKRSIAARRATPISLLAVLLGSGVVAGQQGSGLTPRERQLEVRRAELDEDQAVAALEQAQRLHAEGLVSLTELRRARTERERARISKERALLALSNELPAFRIRWARKIAGERGEVRVRLALETMDDSGASDVGTRSFLVSLRAGNTIISSPYQSRVVSGSQGEVKELEFVLLREVDQLTVSFLSGSRREDVELVVPREDAGQGLRLSSPAAALEGAVGDKVEYAIDVERFSSEITTGSLAIAGLPEGFATEWLDTEAKARVSELRFPEKQDRRRVALRVLLPSEGQGDWVGKELPLKVVVSSRAGGPAASASLDLRLRVVGLPRLILSADNLLVSLDRGEERTVLVTLHNEGGGEARDVRLEVSAPSGTEVDVSPALVRSLAPRGKVSIRLSFRAGRDAVRGEYGMKVRATSDRIDAPSESPELTFRIEIGGGAFSSVVSWFAGIVLLAGLVGAIHAVRKVRR